MLAHHRVEAAPVLGRLDFARVSFADGRDLVGEKDAAFEQVQAPVKLDACAPKYSPGRFVSPKSSAQKLPW